MAKKKVSAVKELSAAELYKLAQEKEEEERQKALESQKQQLQELRTKRRALVTKQKKELAKLDRQIARLSGKKPSRGRKTGRASVTEAVIGIISKAGKITTSDIKAQLAKQGITAGNLPQTLAYLKRQGRVTSPARATYQLAK